MLDENVVFVRKTDEYGYPQSPPFSPSINYPEYDLKSMDNEEKNSIYDCFRNLLYDMGLDKDNFNTPQWNPFKDLVKPHNNVVLKPNLVMHLNGDKRYSIESVVTNGSIIRAVVDYVYIALEGKGKISIGDAPLQSCNFSKVVEYTGLLELKELYKNEKNFDIEIIDFRKECSEISNFDLISHVTKLDGDQSGYTAVDLQTKSILNDISDDYESFRVTNYIVGEMKKHHNKTKHEYLIPNTILNADVVINLPKPKTHRKAGVTGSLKNLVGINGHKDWLPHHREGSIVEKGDEYLNKNAFKKNETRLIRKLDEFGIKGKLIKQKAIYFVYLFNRLFVKLRRKDVYSEGSWWGNDTIWRTVCDLNRVLIYSDKGGNIKDSVQRKLITFCDMIVSGEEEGPLEPTPKKAGIIVGGYNPLIIDAVIASIMGFDFEKIPGIDKGFSIKDYPISNVSVSDIRIRSNYNKWNKKLSDISYRDMLNFKPTRGWENHIEICSGGE